MRERCRNPRTKAYHRYGGRGIVVCQSWIDSFENFLADMGRKPSPQHSIDRIDNDGNYEPGNCRWATRREQGLNTSIAHPLEFNGELLSTTEWAGRIGIQCGSLQARLRRMPVSVALTTAPSPGRSKLAAEQVVEIRRRVAGGEHKAAIAVEFSVSESNIRLIAKGKTWARIVAHGQIGGAK